MRHRWGALVLLTLACVMAIAATTTRCTTYEEKTLGRLQTLCADGTRAVSTWNRTLSRWESPSTPPPRQTCTRRVNPTSRQWEGRCR
jgi:hypothetical protein